jgi:hypothetical protein
MDQFSMGWFGTRGGQKEVPCVPRMDMHRHLWRNNLTFKREREYGPNFLMGHKYM